MEEDPLGLTTENPIAFLMMEKQPGVGDGQTVRFYVPEWDDHVDARYDFVHDEHSVLNRDNRDLAYIWDIFDRQTTPIDGVLISREQVEDTQTKFDRVTSHGVYDAPKLDIPEWLPTISDCGAWGYKSLPFPPYGNQDMLDFYEQLGVTAGVTIDHLVLGSGHTARLYLDKRALPFDFGKKDLPDELIDEVDVMIDTWPESWPEYVAEYEPSIYESGEIEEFDVAVFEGDPNEIIDRLVDDPRAVYRDDDMQFRYDLTLKNAEEIRDLYEAGEYSYRLMVAVQGWSPESYVGAVKQVLEYGYQYIGIGGVAGSNQERIEKIVAGVGNAVKEYERTHSMRVDTHVFGFAKTGAFETIGRSGMTSFDSASMLRAAWTGGENYHLDSERRYDALRVRYPKPSDDLQTSIEKALRAQEVLRALRAFDAGDSIADALRDSKRTAARALGNLEEYLQENRWDERYNASRLRDIESVFRDDYQYGRELKASFSDDFRGRIVKLLRKDSREDPLPFDEYGDLIVEAEIVFEGWTPLRLPKVEAREEDSGEVGTFDQLWIVVEAYAEFISDENLLDSYEELLRAEPWKKCSCPICSEYGIEVATFRGNNRNRRRGFHNTRRFYNEFERELPKLLVLTKGSAQLAGNPGVERYLRQNHADFWDAVHDLPVAEIGVVTANGVHEWWDAAPNTISFAPSRIADEVVEYCMRYQDVYIDGCEWDPSEQLINRLEENGCTVHIHNSPQDLRVAVLDRLDYESEFVPDRTIQAGLAEY